MNLVCRQGPDGTVTLSRQPVPEIREDLLTLFERGELSKYLTEDELSRYDEGSGS